MKLLLLFTAATLFCFGQGRPPDANGEPSNFWPIVYQLPTPQGLLNIETSATLNIAACLRQIPSQEPVVGASVTIATYTTCASGYHAHDNSCATGRPQATFPVSPIRQITDMYGCGYWTAYLPGYAGYYTFEATFNNSQIIGQNYYAKELDQYMTGELQQQIPFMKYPTNSLINNIGNQPVDASHSSQIRYFVPEVASIIAAASNDYANRSIKLIGYYDLTTVWRGSLPDGGTNDDFTSLMNGTIPQWDATTPRWMENAEGTEVDMLNPYQGQPNKNPAASTLLWGVMSRESCVLGPYQISFSPTDPMIAWQTRLAYWNQQPVIHYVCGYAPYHRIGGPGQPN